MQAVFCDYGCLLLTSTDTSMGGWDARMRLSGAPFEPGTRRRVGFAFLSKQGADTISEAGKFYLWEGRIVGEGTVVAGENT